jgi:hypothetical protein
MAQRISFNTYGNVRHGGSRFKIPAYAVMSEADYTPARAVARAIARKNGMIACNVQSQGQEVKRGEVVASHYEVTLGYLAPRKYGGGCNVEGRVFVVIPRKKR